MHALVIEDNAIIAMLIKDELHDLGYSSVDCAATRDEAISAAARHSPDLITCDPSLRAGSSGIAAVRIIRRLLPIPVVLITGDPEAAHGHIKGAAVLGKPFSIRALTKAVGKVMRSARGSKLFVSQLRDR